MALDHENELLKQEVKKLTTIIEKQREIISRKHTREMFDEYRDAHIEIAITTKDKDYFINKFISLKYLADELKYCSTKIVADMIKAKIVESDDD